MRGASNTTTVSGDDDKVEGKRTEEGEEAGEEIGVFASGVPRFTADFLGIGVNIGSRYRIFKALFEIRVFSGRK